MYSAGCNEDTVNSFFGNTSHCVPACCVEPELSRVVCEAKKKKERKKRRRTVMEN